MGRVAQRGGMDLITSFIDVAERVRKLEVMSSSLTVRPRKWGPTEQDEFYDAIVRHIVAMSPWFQGQDGGAPPWGGMSMRFQSRESMYFVNEMETTTPWEGLDYTFEPPLPITGTAYYFDEMSSSGGQALGIDMTLLLMACRALPQMAIPIWTFARSGTDPPHSEIQIGGAENPSGEEVHCEYKWASYRDMYPASWSFFSPGVTFLYPGNTPTPNMVPVNGTDGYYVNGVLTYKKGCYVKNTSPGKFGQPYFYLRGQDDCVWVGASGDVALDCENTEGYFTGLFDFYNPRQAGGIPIGPDQMGTWCQKFGQAHVEGGQSGVYVVASPTDPVLRHPPLPTNHPGAAAYPPGKILRTDYEASSLGVQVYSGFPGWGWLRDQVAFCFDNGLTPNAQAWYEREWEYAKASRNKDWQWIHVNGHLRGYAEASVRDKHVHLRGQIAYPDKWTRPGPICAFDASQIPAPVNAGSYVRLLAQDGFGRPVQIVLQPFGSLWTLTPTYDGTTGLMNGSSHKLVLDGVRWATDQDIPDA